MSPEGDQRKPHDLQAGAQVQIGAGRDQSDLPVQVSPGDSERRRRQSDQWPVFQIPTKISGVRQLPKEPVVQKAEPPEDDETREKKETAPAEQVLKGHATFTRFDPVP